MHDEYLRIVPLQRLLDEDPPADLGPWERAEWYAARDHVQAAIAAGHITGPMLVNMRYGDFEP